MFRLGSAKIVLAWGRLELQNLGSSSARQLFPRLELGSSWLGKGIASSGEAGLVRVLCLLEYLQKKNFLNTRCGTKTKLVGSWKPLLLHLLLTSHESHIAYLGSQQPFFIYKDTSPSFSSTRALTSCHLADKDANMCTVCIHMLWLASSLELSIK